MPERQLRCLTGITPLTCRERSSESIVVPSRCEHLAQERTPRGRAVPIYISVTLPDVAAVSRTGRAGSRTSHDVILSGSYPASREKDETQRYCHIPPRFHRVGKRQFQSGIAPVRRIPSGTIGPAHIYIPDPPTPTGQLLAPSYGLNLLQRKPTYTSEQL